MAEAKSNTITLTRGDTLKRVINIKTREGTSYTPATGDVIKFGLKRSYDDKVLLIEKIIPNDTRILHLLPSDTKNLPFGTYVWDCEIKLANGDVFTIIKKATLKLTEEVV